MKRGIATFAAVLLVISTPSLVPAQGRFPLKYEPSGGDQSYLLMSSGRFVRALEAKPGQLKGVPKDFVGGGTYFQVRLGQEDVLFALDGSKPPKLYVDTNRDGNLSDEKPFEAATGKKGEGLELIGGALTFGPVSVAGGEKGAETRLNIMAYGASFLRICPAGLMSGQVRLGGQDYQVAVVDSNFDGRYDKTFTLPTAAGPEGVEYETFAICRSAERALGEAYEAGAVQPLPKMLRVKDVYYSLKVSGDGSAVEIEKAEPRMGTLDVGQVGAELLLWSENGAHRLSGADGKWQLAAGKYSAKVAWLSRTDGTGAKWTLRGDCSDSEKLGMFEVLAGQTLSIKMGPPLTAKTEVQTEPGQAYVRLMILGQAGEEYSAAVMKGDKEQPAPELRILSESGRVLQTGSFEYG